MPHYNGGKIIRTFSTSLNEVTIQKMLIIHRISHCLIIILRCFGQTNSYENDFMIQWKFKWS